MTTILNFYNFTSNEFVKKLTIFYHTYFRSEKYEKIKNLEVKRRKNVIKLVIPDTGNIDAVFYKSSDNTNIFSFDYILQRRNRIWKALHYVHNAQIFAAYSIEYYNELLAQFFLYIERKNKLPNSMYNCIILHTFLLMDLCFVRNIYLVVCYTFRNIPLNRSVLTLDWLEEW